MFSGLCFLMPTGCNKMIVHIRFQVTHLVVSASKDSDPSYRVNTALKYGIPVVSIDFIDTCVAQGKLLNSDAFVVFGGKASTELSSGKVATSGCLFFDANLCFTLNISS